MPRTYEPAHETYDLVPESRKRDLQDAVGTAVAALRTELLALATSPAEEALVASAYLRLHAGAVTMGAQPTQISLWVATRTRALQALLEHGQRRVDLARHLGVSAQEVGRLLSKGPQAAAGPYRPAGRPRGPEPVMDSPAA